MKLNKIKAMMVERGIKYKEIAVRAGVSPETVYVVLNGHGKSKRIQKAIADIIGLPYERLWGKTAA
ncbi:MAG: helix-turn-helix domain-containing protein [Nitrospirae bacterium]|nr:helix-turn-helix domain-containing protein [Nitrospirota bacterium]